MSPPVLLFRKFDTVWRGKEVYSQELTCAYMVPWVYFVFKVVYNSYSMGSHFLEYCCHAFIDFVCRDLAFWFVSNEILGGLNTLAKQVFCFGWIDDMLC